MRAGNQQGEDGGGWGVLVWRRQVMFCVLLACFFPSAKTMAFILRVLVLQTPEVLIARNNHALPSLHPDATSNESKVTSCVLPSVHPDATSTESKAASYETKMKY